MSQLTEAEREAQEPGKAAPRAAPEAVHSVNGPALLASVEAATLFPPGTCVALTFPTGKITTQV